MRRLMAFTTMALMTACSGTGTGSGSGGSGGGGSGGEGGSGTTSSTGNGVAGPGCPDLRRAFTCSNASEPYTLTISQAFDGQTTTYQYHYSYNDMTVPFSASAEGVLKDGSVYQCRTYQGVPSFSIHPQNDPDSGGDNFINASGD